MILLDENILEGQRLQLGAWGVAARQIGVDVGRKGLQDEEIVVLLRWLRQTTFFTRDLGFYAHDLRHEKYMIVVLAVSQYEVAAFARRLMRHPRFNTQAKRMGTIAKLSASGIKFWQIRKQQEGHVPWASRFEAQPNERDSD